jgi:hypothetical protein
MTQTHSSPKILLRNDSAVGLRVGFSAWVCRFSPGGGGGGGLDWGIILLCFVICIIVIKRTLHKHSFAPFPDSAIYKNGSRIISM